jgi:hypothetical protein
VKEDEISKEYSTNGVKKNANRILTEKLERKRRK